MDIARGMRLVTVATVLGVAGAGLAACANSTMVGHVDMSHLLTPSLVAAATSSGELATTIYGNPFASGTANDEAIAAGMPSPGQVPPFHFTTKPGPNADRTYRVILAFNPPKDSYGSDDAACAADAKDLLAGGSQPAGGPIAVVATFCAGRHFVSQTTVFGPPAASSDTPAFRKLMDDTVENLFPFSANTEKNLLQGGGGGKM